MTDPDPMDTEAAARLTECHTRATQLAHELGNLAFVPGIGPLAFVGRDIAKTLVGLIGAIQQRGAGYGEEPTQLGREVADGR